MRSREWKWMMAVVSALGALAGGSGCNGIFAKPTTELNGNGNAGTEAPKADFAPEFVLAGDDPAFPGTGTGAGADETMGDMNEIVTEGQEIVFKNTVPLPAGESARPMYLAWPEAAFGTVIEDAHFEHRVEDPFNRSLGAPDPVRASFDEKTRRWFIPLSRIFQKPEQDADPADQHLLTLDLQLAQGGRKEFHIRFKARGPLPEVKALPIQLESVRSPEFYAREAGLSGVILAREQFQNPGKRRLVLWVKPGEGEFVFQSVLSVGRYRAQPAQPPTGPFPEKQVSISRFRMAALEVRSQSPGEPEQVNAFSAAVGTWIPVPVGPYERISLAYRASPVSDSVHCQVPPPESRDVSWTTMTPMRCRGGDCEPGFEDEHHQTITEFWSLVGARLQGVLNREVRISESFVTEREATAWLAAGSVSASVRRVAEPGIRVSIGGGEDAAPETARFACQGIF